jgi:RNA polymerase sigma-70 factor, ECF subfamily
MRAVMQAKAGDHEGLRYLYLTYADSVYGYVCSIVRDEHEAEDVTQHVFAKLITALQRYEQRSMPFSAWILRVAHNVAIDHVRAKRGIPCEYVPQEHWEADDQAFDRLSSLRVALSEVPEDQRRVLLMRHVLGLSPLEIATRLGKSENAVNGLHHRGRRSMQEALRRLGMEPATAAA